MKLFALVMNILETSIICLALYNHFHLNKKEIMLFFTLIFTVLTISLFSVSVNNFSIILVIGIMIIGLYFFKKVNKLENIIFCIFIIITDILCNFVALYFISYFFAKSIASIGNDTNVLIIASIASKLFFFIAILLFLEIKFYFDNTLEFKKWWIISIVFAMLVLILCILGEGLIFNKITDKHIIFTIIALIIIFFMIVMIYYRIQEENKELVRILVENERRKYTEKNYQIITRLSDEINESEHRMMYILMQIKSLIHKKDYQKANTVISDYIDNINKFSVFINTKNPYFDFIMNRKFNEIYSKGIICKTNIFVSNGYGLENEDLTTIICLILEFLCSLKDADKVIDIDIQQEKKLLICIFSRLRYSKDSDVIVLPEKFYNIVKNYDIIYLIKEIDNILQIKFIWNEEII